MPDGRSRAKTPDVDLDVSGQHRPHNAFGLQAADKHAVADGGRLDERLAC
jgi:hypothetical protein